MITKLLVRFSFFLLSFGFLFACNSASIQTVQTSATGNIVHTVMFSLKHEIDAPETMKFLLDGQRILTAIPSVQNFQVMRQVSKKNEFDFFFSMEFADQTAYQLYNDHPDHVKFVKERWEKEVVKFLEADFVKLVE
jgi:hypothetical protein